MTALTARASQVDDWRRANDAYLGAAVTWGV